MINCSRSCFGIFFWWKLWVIDWSAGIGSSNASHICQLECGLVWIHTTYMWIRTMWIHTLRILTMGIHSTHYVDSYHLCVCQLWWRHLCTFTVWINTLPVISQQNLHTEWGHFATFQIQFETDILYLSVALKCTFSCTIKLVSVQSVSPLLISVHHVHNSVMWYYGLFPK